MASKWSAGGLNPMHLGVLAIAVPALAFAAFKVYSMRSEEFQKKQLTREAEVEAQCGCSSATAAGESF